MVEIKNKFGQILSNLPINNRVKNYNLAKLRHDLQSGLTVGIMVVPQSMAYAMIAGVPPIYGLYACIFPLLIYPIFGTSKHIIRTTIAIDMLIISVSLGAIANAGSSEYLILVAILSLLVGIIQIIMFSVRLGFLINYLSRPVINGFITAAALIIVAGQLGSLMGIQISRSAFFYDILLAIFTKISALDYTTFILGIGSIILIISIKYWKPVFPSSLMVIIVGIIISWFFKLPQKSVKVVGEIPSGLPDLQIPQITLSNIRNLLSTAITLALIQFMTVTTLARVYASRHDYSIDSNKELLALGLGNIMNSFFQGLPASASFSNSAVNEQAHCKTAFSNVFTALVVIFTLLFLTPLFSYLPYASLAAVVIVAGFNLIDIKAIKYLYNAKKRDFYIALFTFIITLFIGIQEGILLGITASLLSILYRQSNPNVAELGHLPGTRSFKDLERYAKAEQIDKILILRIDASFSFANAEYFKAFILEKSAGRGGNIEALILDCSAINDLDTTALAALEKIIDTLREREIELYLAGLKGPVREVMKRVGIYEQLGEHKRIFRSPYRAILDILDRWNDDGGNKHLGKHYKNTDKYSDKKNWEPPKYEPDDKAS